VFKRDVGSKLGLKGRVHVLDASMRFARGRRAWEPCSLHVEVQPNGTMKITKKMGRETTNTMGIIPLSGFQKRR